jgi:hypothetical protein
VITQYINFVTFVWSVNSKTLPFPCPTPTLPLPFPTFYHFIRSLPFPSLSLGNYFSSLALACQGHGKGRKGSWDHYVRCSCKYIGGFRNKDFDLLETPRYSTSQLPLWFTSTLVPKIPPLQGTDTSDLPLHASACFSAYLKHSMQVLNGIEQDREGCLRCKCRDWLRNLHPHHPLPLILSEHLADLP